MENKIVLLDTSVLIDNFRKKQKEKSLLVYLTNEYNKFCISSVTEYEIYIGSTGIQLPYWENVLQEINIISFDRNAAHSAVLIQNQLKIKRKTIDIADFFIAATALSNNLPIATLNRKHFDLIDNLEVITNID
jgi:tRNA(fMet)-specific endonuclease VapC